MSHIISNISRALFVAFITFNLSSCFLIEETGSSSSGSSSSTTEKPKPKTTVDKNTKVQSGPSKAKSTQSSGGATKQTKGAKKK